jgi:hypothetical protein
MSASSNQREKDMNDELNEELTIEVLDGVVGGRLPAAFIIGVEEGFRNAGGWISIVSGRLNFNFGGNTISF